MAVTWLAFRGRNDDGSESAATWKAAENVDWSQVPDENFRVRFEGNNNANLSQAGQLQYNLNGAGWINVTASSAVVIASASPNVADGATLTSQMTTSALATTAQVGRFDEVDGATPAFQWGGNRAGELEYCLQLVSGDVVNGDTVELRVDMATVVDSYTLTPVITVDEAAAGVSGSIDSQLPVLTQDVTGEVDVQGTIDSVLPALTQDVTGSVASDITGAIAQTLPALTQDAAGEVDVQGSVAQTLPALTQSASGVLEAERLATVTSLLPRLEQMLEGEFGQRILEGFEVAYGCFGYGKNRRKKRFASGEGRVQR